MKVYNILAIVAALMVSLIQFIIRFKGAWCPCILRLSLQRACKLERYPCWICLWLEWKRHSRNWLCVYLERANERHCGPGRFVYLAQWKLPWPLPPLQLLHDCSGQPADCLCLTSSGYTVRPAYQHAWRYWWPDLYRRPIPSRRILHGQPQGRCGKPDLGRCVCSVPGMAA